MIAVIPARYGSTRFPGKPLARISGVPMILRVAREATRIRGVDRVVVATDDRRILDCVLSGGYEAVITSKSHRSGTSRVAEVAAAYRYGLVLNIQGDEPLLPVGGVERLIDAMKEDRRCLMGTLATPSTDADALKSSDVVKVVTSRDGMALYFSRSPVPGGKGKFLHHTGVYIFRRPFLLRYSSLPVGPLEKREGLEQLRALENGFGIRVVTCRKKSLGVDRPGDIKRVEKEIKRG
ncbi:MAG: 3-deoxy-manno-octulosonate cytidylyltransferase [Candidatus Krumholzibacteria bacterium]|nr:3-deoxy-manno-octulosonate cytidylyltransferase [Candidatus Krumholzibacteria bacterium]